MIYGYMRQQKAKSASTISPVKIEAFYAENKDRFYQEDSVQLRLIQVTRAPGDSDDLLRNKAATIVSELAAGADFGDVARKYSQDSRKGKGGDWGWQRRSDLRKERSEEHTSELQSPDHLVCRLLLEKKKKQETALRY